jgi:hypothetical protein
MSQIRSPSLGRCYGMVRVARVWKISRASAYRSRKEMPPNTSGRRPGPGGACDLPPSHTRPTEVDGWQRLSRVSQNRAAVHLRSARTRARA